MNTNGQRLLLDLFCGAGGAGMGYYRAGFEVTGVDIAPQSHYPFEFVQGDAIEFCRQYGARFDVIHASPPCQAYTGMRRITLSRFGHAPEHPDLIPATRDALIATGRPYVVENVVGAPLLSPFLLCGASLGLPGLARHRLFETNVMLPAPPRCAHLGNDLTIGVYGKRPDGRRLSYRKYRPSRAAKSLEEAQRVMGIEWMDWDEIRNAIPPVYTEWIGRHLRALLENERQSVAIGALP